MTAGLEEYPARAEDETADEATGEPEAAYRSALASAVRSLAQREHGRRELERKLTGKGHAPVLVERVLDYLSAHDLQSDERYAEGFVRSRIQKGYGPVKIRQELASRGVSEDALERQLTEPGEFWLDLARRVLDRKFGRATVNGAASGQASGHVSGKDEPDAADGFEEDREAWNARARFLARRGFPADLIYRALGPERG